MALEQLFSKMKKVAKFILKRKLSMFKNTVQLALSPLNYFKDKAGV